MSAAFEWRLARGSSLWFYERDDESGIYDVDYVTDGSAGFITNALPLAEAEAVDGKWLRATGKRRLMVIDGGAA